MKGSLQTVLAANPQANVLRDYLEDANIGHGDVVRGKLRRVNVDVGAIGKPAAMRFCNVTAFEPTRFIRRGDGGEIPLEVKIEGFKLTHQGYYDLDVEIEVNGAMQVRAVAEENTAVLVEQY